MKKQQIAWTLRIVVAALFLLSAFAKLYPSPYFAISTFEFKQLGPLGFDEFWARYFSRTLIGIEFALGILLLQKHFLRSIVVPATFLLLGVFVIHLTAQTYFMGNSGNCGCFGELLPMTPVEAIIKNIVAMGLLVWLFKLLPKTGEQTHNFWVLTTTVLSFILLLFVIAPIQPVSGAVVDANAPIETDIPATVEPESATPVDTTSTVTKETKTGEPETTEVVVEEPPKRKSGYASYFADADKGKTTLCFFVPGCDHCRDAAKELTEMKKRNKNFPKIEIIFMNEEAEKIPEFFQYAGAAYPYKIIEIIPFWKALGDGKDTPGVKYLWNGNEYVYYWGIEGNAFNPAAYEKLVGKSFSELKKP